MLSNTTKYFYFLDVKNFVGFFGYEKTRLFAFEIY